MLHWEVQISNHSENMQGDLLPFNHKYLEFDGNPLLRNEALELISPETSAGLWQSLFSTYSVTAFIVLDFYDLFNEGIH